MESNVLTCLSGIATASSVIISIVALIITSRTQKKLKDQERKKNTIEAFSIIQSEVLDGLVDVDVKNAEMMVDDIDEKECKEAYDAYRTMIARLEHFAVGINEGVYDFATLNKLAGKHLLFSYKKLSPIIEYANRFSNNNEYYGEYQKLINRIENEI